MTPTETATHTPGPWRLREERPTTDNSSARWFVMAERWVLAETKALPPRFTGSAEANARLIAAAPELLAACAQLLACCKRRDGSLADYEHALITFTEDGSMLQACIDAAATAIAKVEGR